ncbi:glycosyltransferase family 4 protein [Phenylobacterium conjunctum]|uniref:Glycosyltransferase family 4 protein n=1 Tax=Phenylobacterium conjunctum TaxID=1298959 RepID=A0ABW3T7M1_9CAUL
MPTKRILIIVENLPVPFDRRVWLEATTLSNAGYHVSVICPKGKGYEKSFETLEGVHIYRHALPLEASGPLGYLLEYGSALIWQMLLSIRVALAGRIDVIHACNPPDLIFLVAAPFRLFGTRFLFDQHDLCPEVYESKFSHRGPFYRMLSIFERMTYGLADVIISTNESYRAVAMTRGGVSAEDVFVVRSGPDITRWPKRPPPDEKWKNGRRHLVGYIGVMGEQEGLDLLLKSIRKIVYVDGRDDIQFVLIGDGSYRAHIQKMASDFGLCDYVTFTGRVSDAELLSAIGTSDVCVNPDRFSVLNDKSTMNKIIEYMALSKPIVQFDLTEGRYSAQGASLYVAHDDTDAFAEAIVSLIDQPELRASMGALGRERVETELGWGHQVPQLLAAYDHIFRGR